ncbi:phosphoglucomutase/phosphomannomutase family protein [Desulfallas thermosapovorans]|uniref:Phosphoglucomutase n=1 Tax=Desulfallas thermosapovorans DSM 6562 TaxID=1121431 RepID=A0A5S4ZPQ2_9FIRM|nr:phosphoglucomutase/phosphomannomutase family protein [Desulfallas thermosapovorans]TYO94800.1 alpha-D-glucose phosphate-specific phosphoglucomutase [Desulfallas thermosapovorans DSM 6562]
MRKLKFGTDGWRGIIADDFTFENLRIVSQAVADYVNGQGAGHKGIVVGYDNRFLSDRFADTVADVMIQNGIKVYLADSPLPTPVTAFAVKVHEAAGAVMLTASHNPPEYNGFKFIPDYAGPALPHITGAIEENITRLQNKMLPARWADQEQAMELADVLRPGDDAARAAHRKEPAVAERIIIDPRPEYFEHLEQLVDMEAIGRANLQVMVDAMHGSGMGYLNVLLEKAGTMVKQCRCYRDPLFGGGMPEPTGKTLTGVCDWIKEREGRLGLALDGDADRFGIIDDGGVYVTPNQFLPLLYHHLITVKGLVGPVTRTVATTHMLDRIARRHGQEVYETAVGFKYIGQNLLEKGCVLGGEESGGLSIKGHIPEKDGILAGLLAVEIVAMHRKNLLALARDVAEEYGGPLYSERLDVRTTPLKKQPVLDKLGEFNPAVLGGTPVAGRVTVDGVKLLLESGEWVLVRASGTEPVFRIYVETHRPERVKELSREVAVQIGLDD